MKLLNMSRDTHQIKIQNADTAAIQNLMIGPGVSELPPGYEVPFAERPRYESFLRIVEDSGLTRSITSEHAVSIASPASDPRPGNGE